MNMSRLPYIVLMLLSVITLQAQKTSFASVKVDSKSKIDTKPIRNCYTPQMEDKLQAQYPNRLGEGDFESRMKKFIESNKYARTTDQLYRIPTIVHVIHNGEDIGEGVNITSEQVMSQFDVLNEDFRRLGAGFNDHPDGADILIEFYPALYDVDGVQLSEPGIDRVNGGEAFWEEVPVETALKPTTIWDPERFFNIWVVNFGGDLDGILGYAQFPTLSDLDGLEFAEESSGIGDTDGVIIGYQYFGATGNVVVPYNLGRTTTHEVGHWLGLRHIWGDGDCSADDYCADTPNAGEPNYSCAVVVDTCPGDGLNDMVENYMDYTNDNCMNIFTQDQKERMRVVMQVSPRRNNLIQQACTEAEVVGVGTHTASPTEWFYYQSSEAEVVTISSVGTTTEDTYLGVFSSCNSDPIILIDDLHGSSQSAFSTVVDAGDELYILWDGIHSAAAFDWTLSSASAIDGAACGAAVVVSPGTISVPTTSFATYWYEFTMPAEPSMLDILMPSKSAMVYSGTCDALELVAETSGELTIRTLPPNEKVYLAIEADGGDFDFEVSTTVFEEGEACFSASSVTLGTHTSPSGDYWYDFANKSGFGQLYFVSTSSAELSIYTDCGESELGTFTTNMEDTTWVSIDEDEEVKLHWKFSDSASSLDWEVGFLEYDPGLVCGAAIEVVEGVISSPLAPLWYTYTASQDGVLTISSVGYTGEDTYLGVLDGCDGAIVGESDDFDGLQSEVTIPSVKQGDVFKIVWLDFYSVAGFDWVISIRDQVDGEYCEDPRTASIGANEAVITESEFLWYEFTPTEADKKLTISSNQDDYVFFVTDDCENNELYTSGAGNASFIGYEVNERLFIVWQFSATSDFIWNLAYKDLESGNLCSTASTATEGTNTIATMPSWYTYTMPEDGSIKITTVDITTEDTHLAVHDGCDGNLMAESDDYDYAENVLQSEVVIYDLVAGDELLIEWKSTWTTASFNWELVIFQPAPGEICTSAVTIEEPGLIQNTAAPLWYKYVMPMDRYLKISSVGLTEVDTYLEAYEGCGQSAGIYGISDDDVQAQSELTIENLSEGDEIFIRWVDAYSADPFNWLVSINETPETQDHQFEVNLEHQVGDVIGTIEASDQDDDVISFVLEDVTDPYFDLDNISGELTVTNLSDLMDLSGEYSINVLATDGLDTATSQVTILLNLLALESANLIFYPNPSAGTISIDSGIIHNGGQVHDLSGKLLDTFMDLDFELDLSRLPTGVYMISLDTNTGVVQQKLIITK